VANDSASPDGHASNAVVCAVTVPVVALTDMPPTELVKNPPASPPSIGYKTSLAGENNFCEYESPSVNHRTRAAVPPLIVAIFLKRFGRPLTDCMKSVHFTPPFGDAEGSGRSVGSRSTAVNGVVRLKVISSPREPSTRVFLTRSAAPEEDRRWPHPPPASRRDPVDPCHRR